MLEVKAERKNPLKPRNLAKPFKGPGGGETLTHADSEI